MVVKPVVLDQWRDELEQVQDRLGELFVRPEPRRQAGLYLAPSTCWARDESWASWTANRDDAGYAATLMLQTSCHASKAWARAARYSVAGMRWRGRRKRLLIWSWAERNR